MPFTQQKKNLVKRIVPLALMLIILALFWVFTQNTDNTGTAAGLVLLPLLIWSLVYIRKNSRHSIVTFIALLVLTVSIAMSLLSRLTGISLL